MAGIFAFKCTCCGEVHEGSPSFSYPMPAYVAQLPESEKENIIESGTDLYKVKYGEGFHYFVRVCLEIPIHGHEDPLLWGVWVSLSEQSLNRYIETCEEVDETDSYFGWFCNSLPYYEETQSIKAQVRPRSGGLRPYLELERNGHELAEDLYNGITAEKAQKIAEICMHQG